MLLCWERRTVHHLSPEQQQSDRGMKGGNERRQQSGRQRRRREVNQDGIRLSGERRSWARYRARERCLTTVSD